MAPPRWFSSGRRETVRLRPPPRGSTIEPSGDLQEHQVSGALQNRRREDVGPVVIHKLPRIADDDLHFAHTRRVLSPFRRMAPTRHERADSPRDGDDAGVDPPFAVIRDAGGRTDFDLYARWSPALRRAFFDSGPDGLVANSARGFTGTAIEFVRDLPLRRLHILDRGITDLTPLHDLWVDP
jgi:hypothetical protein